MTEDRDSSKPLLERALEKTKSLSTYDIVFIVLIVLAAMTRFVDLESRVMSHDETTHVYFSWLFERNGTYSHDPLSHGPLQFHLVALSYFLFGDSDATARFPAALAGVLSVGILWYFKRWLGKKGAIAAGVLMLISPFMLYYSRYVRNEMLVVPLVLLMFLALFRYLETRQSKWLYLFSLSLSLHFATKETAYIHTALLLIFLAVLALWQWVRHPWQTRMHRVLFYGGIGIAGLGLASMLYGYIQSHDAEVALSTAGTDIGSVPSMIAFMGLVILVLGVVLVFASLLMEYGRRLRTDFPLFDLLIVSGTMVLPLLAALPAVMLGWDPLAYYDPESLLRTTIVVLVLMGMSGAIGMLWDWKRWLISAAVFYIPFLVLYTSVFTNGTGLASGLVGSLGYWLAQQAVERGGQPKYYYILLQIPVYEFLPALGVAAAGITGLFHRRPSSTMPPLSGPAADENSGANAKTLFLMFLGYWTLMNILAFSYAGERMPWITVHLVLPMILLAGWFFGRFLDAFDWAIITHQKGLIVLVSAGIFLLALLNSLGLLFGANPPFAGSQAIQLQSTMNFIASLVTSIITAAILLTASKGWRTRQYLQLFGGLLLAVLTVVTVRASFRAAFVAYDEATEFLVYAHSARGPKTALEQVEELSVRMTGDQGLRIAYDNETTYPFWWYLRNYPNAMNFGANPSRDLLNYPVILAGDPNWARIDPLLEDRYEVFEYQRIIWPMQDYWNLTWERVKGYVTSPEYRSALFDIWLNRDYSAYGTLTGGDYSLENWSPSTRFRLYVRKDIAAMVWDYGQSGEVVTLPEFEDPYIDRMTTVIPDLVFGGPGVEQGLFNAPRNMAFAADGSFYVADSLNHRIQHISADGLVLNVWGTFADQAQTEAPGGTFYEPWAIAIAPDGTLYVADTWNHRIQHFSADGEFLDQFGYFGQAETEVAFWGPRDVLVDSDGRLFVMDTGNKRIVIFDENDEYITEFGMFGLAEGEFDEPVAFDFGSDGLLYITDTWNQRIQVFEPDGQDSYRYRTSWDVDAWYGQSLDNKPYIAVRGEAVCVSDPEGYRVLCFNTSGEFLQGWDIIDQASGQYGMPYGLVFADDCSLWVSDGINGRLIRYPLDICSP